MLTTVAGESSRYTVCSLIIFVGGTIVVVQHGFVKENVILCVGALFVLKKSTSKVNGLGVD